jgi:hypothetical protein
LISKTGDVRREKRRKEIGDMRWGGGGEFGFVEFATKR